MEYDIFISHASEDKDEFVRPLAENLKARGLLVWYDEFTLRLGDSLAGSIGKGLTNSSFGLVVLSPNFFAKKWPQRELAALIAREDIADKVIIPIWHKVAKRDIISHEPLLADKVAANSAEGIEAVAQRILEIVSPSRIADKIYERGTHAEAAGDIDPAISSYIDVLRIDRNHADALRRLEVLLSRQAYNRINLKLLLGCVKWYRGDKGFGFVAAEDGRDYFVHVSTLERDGISQLTEGDRVAFVRQKTDREAIISIRIILPLA